MSEFVSYPGGRRQCLFASYDLAYQNLFHRAVSNIHGEMCTALLQRMIRRMPSFYAYMFSRSIAKSASQLVCLLYILHKPVKMPMLVCVQRVNKESYLMVTKAVRTQNKELPSDSLTSMEELYVNILFSYNLTEFVKLYCCPSQQNIQWQSLDRSKYCLYCWCCHMKGLLLMLSAFRSRQC